MLKTLVVVMSVSLVCSFLVTTTSVLLEDRQRQNLFLERVRHVLEVVGIEGGSTDLISRYRERITPLLVNLETGEEVDPAGLPGFVHPDQFDFVIASKEPEYSQPIPDSPIGLKRKPRLMPVYLVHGAEGLEKVILLIVGKGLWSTLQGYLALENDLTTIYGIRFFQQGETPGLGGEITNPRWQSQWGGKQAFDSRGKVVIKVVKGPVDPSSSTQVEGLSGATLTTRAVDHLVRYWLGPDGYGPYLERLRQRTGGG